VEGFEIRGGIERDGVLLAIKDEKKKEAEQKIIMWLQNLGLLK